MIGKYDHDYNYVVKSIKNSHWSGDKDINSKSKIRKLLLKMMLALDMFLLL